MSSEAIHRRLCGFFAFVPHLDAWSQAIMNADFLDSFVSLGEGVKTISRTADTATIGARVIVFGSLQERDLVGDWFTAKTYLGANKGVGVDMMLNHGIPLSKKPELKAYADILLPPVVKTEVDEHGLLYETVLNLKDGYQRKIFQMVEDGLLSSSSGALNHAVKRKGNVKAGEIERWIIGEISLTPNPCEPRVGFAASLKSLMQDEIYEPESMRAAVKTLTDTGFSLNVPLEYQNELEESDDETKTLGRSFGTHMTQPRDDHGRWTDGAGTLSSAHVATVMHSEGIHESKHGEVLDKIKDGTHKTRADVLKHIDSIHAGITGGGVERLSDEHLDRAHRQAMALAPPATADTAPGKIVTDYFGRPYKLEQSKNGELQGRRIDKNGKLGDIEKPESKDEWKEATPALTAILNEARQRKGLQSMDSVMSAQSNSRATAGDAIHAAGAGGKAQLQQLEARQKELQDFVRANATDKEKQAISRAQVAYRENPKKGKKAFAGIDSKFADAAIEYIEIGKKILSAGRKSLFFDDDIEYSIDDDIDATKHLDYLSEGQLEGTRFTDHSSRLLEANEEYMERVQSLVQSRAANRKSERVLSADNHERLSSHFDALRAICDELEALLEAHKPMSQTQDATEIESKVLDAQLAFARMTAQMDGVLLLTN